MRKAQNPVSALLAKDNFQRFATRMRVAAWVWIAIVFVAYAAQLDLPSALALELSSVMAIELLGFAALAVFPASLGLALSFVFERISYLTSDLQLF